MKVPPITSKHWSETTEEKRSMMLLELFIDPANKNEEPLILGQASMQCMHFTVPVVTNEYILYVY